MLSSTRRQSSYSKPIKHLCAFEDSFRSTMKSSLILFLVGSLASTEAFKSDSIRGAGRALTLATRVLDEAFPVDISSYSLRFEQCQGVKVPHVDQEDETGSVQRYAVFRLCPRHDCSNCDEGFGEYVLELTEYLQVLSHYIHETKGALCETCNHCQVDEEKAKAESKLEDFNSNCKHCAAECQMLDKLEVSGYIDATEFAGCTLIHSDTDGQSYYAGPVCSMGGEAISIGVFRDSYCSSQDASKDIRDFLVNMDGEHKTIAYSFMKLTYIETCFSCMEDQIEGLHDFRIDQKDNDNVKNFCEVVYDSAQKCEAKYGFALANMERDGAFDEESETCELIDKMKSHKRHKRNGDQGEQFIEDGRKMLDTQTLIIVVVGLAFSCLLIICKVCCNTDVSYTAVSNDMQAHDDFEDDPVAKYSDERADVVEDVTEGESSSSSFLEESGLADQPESEEN